ncbi:hypothetical protein BpHYR1_049388 [Brachionus plicatilis]|uniref:Uncharacterized protein n=1 Tax=Brachionus plicatilis TaxID=10195 RepID=A0A3M7RDR9_BRAPC|nr:hypothetical protein BpHYR1_049388 [Brachionus plicatilis]
MLSNESSVNSLAESVAAAAAVVVVVVVVCSDSVSGQQNFSILLNLADSNWAIDEEVCKMRPDQSDQLSENETLDLSTADSERLLYQTQFLELRICIVDVRGFVRIKRHCFKKKSGHNYYLEWQKIHAAVIMTDE